MKKGFKVILIISIILVVIGILCVAIPACLQKLDFDEYSKTVVDIIDKHVRTSFDVKINTSENSEHTSEIQEQLGEILDEASDSFREIGSQYAIDQDGIKEIDIDWVAGTVEIQSGSGNIEFYETASGDCKPLDFSVHGDTLAISYTEDNSSDIHFDGAKTLYLTIPAALIPSLEIETVSADIHISDLEADEVSLDSVSGCGELSAIDCKEFDSSSISGAIVFDGLAQEISCTSTSGDIEIASSVCPKELAINTTTGQTTLSIPEGSSFTLNVETVSGDVTSDFDLLYSTKNEHYLVGKGDCEFEFSSISGDLNIRTY